MTKLPNAPFNTFGHKWKCSKCGYWQIYDNLGWKETRNDKYEVIKKRKWGFK